MARKSRKSAIDYAAVSEQWLKQHESKRKPTINDVASLAAVSKKTVSRVINQSPLVNEETRTAINEIIERIGYRPDPQARGLAYGRSFLVGLVYDNPNPQYVVNMQRGILDGLKGTGFELVVHPCDRKSATFLEDARRFIEAQKLYGVVLTPSVSEDEDLADILRDIGCAYIRIASVNLDTDRKMIVTNDRLGGEAAARHLAKLGHRDIAIVVGPQSFRSTHERRAGFEDGLAESGMTIRPTHVLQGDYTFESGLERGADLLKLDPVPTAVFALNDEMAAGVLQALRLAGQEAPDSVSVVGYDDFEVASRVWPRLTTVHTPTHEIGKLAAERLLDLEKDIDAGPNQTKPRLVERESTRALKSGET